eukprot:GEMP01019831.1.p1 GENE.GEMP01019831.1~~GEMP01019831.1.p1  ORF type:complete len:665 (+),score=140.77 GEMP01019831.1:222-2216(+)
MIEKEESSSASPKEKAEGTRTKLSSVFVSASQDVRSAQLATILLICLIFVIWMYFAYTIFFSSSPHIAPLSESLYRSRAVEPIQERANKQTIYGSVAGLVTSIVTLCGGVGLNLRFEKVLILGMATLVANGCALSVGEYIAVSTHDDFMRMQSTRGLSEILSTREVEIQRLVRHYEQRKGLSFSAASNIAHAVAAQGNDKLWVETLIHAELGLMPSCVEPLYAAYSVFVSFLYFGILPYMGAVATAILRMLRHNLFAPQCSVLSSIILALFALFVFGHESATMRKSTSALFMGFLMMASGLLAVTVSFVGTYLAPREFSRMTPPQSPVARQPTLTAKFQHTIDDTVTTMCSSTPSPQTRPDLAQNIRRCLPHERRRHWISADESSWPLFQGPLCKVLFMTWIAIGIGLTLRACFFHMVVFGYGLFTCLVTGLGVVPLLLFDCLHKDVGAIANSVACGTMVAASIGLLIESVATSEAWCWQLWLGVALGVVFILCSQSLIDEEPAEMLVGVAMDKKDANKVLLFVTVMFVHSMAEGIACGVSFQRNDSFGRYVAFALAAHNIPEGLAIALVLLPGGFSKRMTTLVAILSSAPQPFLAALSMFFVDSMKYLLPIGLAFAAGAMIYVAVLELGIPALDHLGVKRFGFCGGTATVSMFALQAWIQAAT